MKDKYTLFDYLNAIFYKRKVPYDKKVASAYILMLWLSEDKNLIHMINDINSCLFILKDKMVYDYFWYGIPKGKRFIKFTKKKKDKKDNEKLIEQLMFEKKLSKEEAKRCLILNFVQ